jgi:hypothetical protein
VQYLARITIHDGNYAEYKDLHDRMQGIGFQRFIKSDGGRYYLLPDATYVGESSGNPIALRDLMSNLAAAAAPSKDAPEVLLSQRSSTYWSGLKELT